MGDAETLAKLETKTIEKATLGEQETLILSFTDGTRFVVGINGHNYEDAWIDFGWEIIPKTVVVPPFCF